jgi:hypothetical protein
MRQDSSVTEVTVRWLGFESCQMQFYFYCLVQTNYGACLASWSRSPIVQNDSSTKLHTQLELMVRLRVCATWLV